MITSAVGHAEVQVQEKSPIDLVGSDNVCNLIVAGKVVRCLLDTGSILKKDYPLYH